MTEWPQFRQVSLKEASQCIKDRIIIDMRNV